MNLLFKEKGKKPRESGAFFLVIFSALLYSASLMLPCARWCSFLFLIPLYLAVCLYSISLRHGFLWGVIAYTFLFSFIVLVLVEYGAGKYRLLAYPFLICYGACSSAIWFYAAHFLSRKIPFVISWLGTTVIYFWWVDVGMFMVFGVWEGNGLFFPLLGLLEAPKLLWALQWISKHLLFAFLCLGSMLSALFFYTFRKYYLLTAISVYFFFFTGGFFYQEDKEPAWLPHVGVIQNSVDAGSALQQAREITYNMIRLYEKYPTIRCIFAPESLFKYPFNSCKQAQEMWLTNIVSDHVSICCGVYRTERNNLYNSLCLITEKQDTRWHDKQHLFYFTEYVPRFWLWFSSVSSLFIDKEKTFSIGNQQRKPLSIPGVGSFVPYLCSELLLTTKQQAEYRDLPVLCLANDKWFSDSYMPRLMFLQARMKALEWKRSILYIAYRHAALLGKYGNAYSLQIYK